MKKKTLYGKVVQEMFKLCRLYVDINMSRTTAIDNILNFDDIMSIHSDDKFNNT